MLNLTYNLTDTPTPWDLPSALIYFNMTAAQMAAAGSLTLKPFTFPGTNWDYRAKVDDGDGYGSVYYTFQGLAGATYTVSVNSFFNPSGTNVYDSQGVNLFNGAPGTGGYSSMTFVAPYSGTYYVKPNWSIGAYYTYFGMDIFADVDTAGPKVASQSPPNQGQVAALTTNLQITFNEDILRGSGTITLSHTADNGNVVDEVFDVATSNRLSINGKVLTIDPTKDLDERYTYTVTITSGAVKDADGRVYGGTSGTGQGYTFSTDDAANHKYFGIATNEVFKGGPGFDTIDGGGGIDTAQYGGNYSLYKVLVGASSVSVVDSRGYSTHASDNTDTLTNVERLQFADVRLALDLKPTQAGGEALLMLAAAVGAPALANKALVGVFVGYFDAGFSLRDGAAVLVNSGIMAAFAAGTDNASFARYVYTNVNGKAPDAATLANLVAPLDAQTIGQVQWLADMAASAANQTHVNLVGYAGTGLQYLV